jgi:hypothetical protein
LELNKQQSTRKSELKIPQCAEIVARCKQGATIRHFQRCSTVVVESLPRPGIPKTLSIQEERKIFRAFKREPRITYRRLVVEASVEGCSNSPLLRKTTPSRATIYRLPMIFSLRGEEY